MGLSRLELVRPIRFPDPQADWRAAGGIDIVKQARVHDTLLSAIGDCGLVVATTARDRHVASPLIDVTEFVDQLAAGRGRQQPVAVVFGRESSGLTNEEIDMAHACVRIPAHAEYGSLNLAMAVQVVAYELFKAATDSAGPFESDAKLATRNEVEDFFVHMERVLQDIEFYEPENPRNTLPRLKRLYNRLRLEQVEVAMLRGILSNFERKLHSDRRK